MQANWRKQYADFKRDVAKPRKDAPKIVITLTDVLVLDLEQGSALLIKPLPQALTPHEFVAQFHELVTSGRYAAILHPQIAQATWRNQVIGINCAVVKIQGTRNVIKYAIPPLQLPLLALPNKTAEIPPYHHAIYNIYFSTITTATTVPSSVQTMFDNKSYFRACVLGLRISLQAYVTITKMTLPQMLHAYQIEYAQAQQTQSYRAIIYPKVVILPTHIVICDYRNGQYLLIKPLASLLNPDTFTTQFRTILLQKSYIDWLNPELGAAPWRQDILDIDLAVDASQGLRNKKTYDIIDANPPLSQQTRTPIKSDSNSFAAALGLIALQEAVTPTSLDEVPHLLCTTHQHPSAASPAVCTGELPTAICIEEIAAVQRLLGPSITYICDKNSVEPAIKPNLFIAPVAKLGRKEKSMGVYTKAKITAGTVLGRYQGKKIALDSLSETADTSYVFAMGRRKFGIDALTQRNWAGMVNSGSASIANLDTCRTPQGDIIYVANQLILPGSQLLIDYGDDYQHSPAEYRFLRPSDTWLESAEIYRQHQSLYYVDDWHCPALDLQHSKIINLHIDQLQLATVDLPILCFDEHDQLKSQYEQENFTRLMFSCWQGNQRELKILLTLGADVNLQSSICGLGALHFVIISPIASQKKLVMLQLLLQRGALLTLQDAANNTVLHWAIQYHECDLISYLLQNAEAPEKYVNNDNLDFFLYALVQGNPAVVKLVLSYARMVDYFTQGLGKIVCESLVLFLQVQDNKLADYIAFFTELLRQLSSGDTYGATRYNPANPKKKIKTNPVDENVILSPEKSSQCVQQLTTAATQSFRFFRKTIVSIHQLLIDHGTAEAAYDNKRPKYANMG